MSSGIHFLQRYRERLSLVESEQFIDVHEGFVRELAGRESDPTDGLNTDERELYIAFFSQCQRRYLATKEREASETMMALLNGATASAVETISGSFGRAAYERVRDLKEIVDFRSCSRVVMVGSGAFPVTLFWLHDHFPQLHYTGLDIDARCVEMAAALTKAMGLSNIQFEAIDGSHHDFDGADLVYVANQVVPKKSVLEQVCRSDSTTQVVIREPTRRGELLAEAVRYDVPSEFAIEDKGFESPTFLSYDLYLRRRG